MTDRALSAFVEGEPALLLSVETDRTLETFGSDGWIIREGATGPFIGQTPLLASTIDAVCEEPGVAEAEGVIFSRKTVEAGSPEEVNLFGVERRGVGAPPVDHGRGPRESGDIVVSTTLHHGVGDEILLSGKPFRVVGTITNWTVVAGVPNVLVSLTDAQEVAFVDQPISPRSPCGGSRGTSRPARACRAIDDVDPERGRDLPGRP